jgi:hypothetical protein
LNTSSFSSAIATGASTEATNLSVGIVDEDHSDLLGIPLLLFSQIEDLHAFTSATWASATAQNRSRCTAGRS